MLSVLSEFETEFTAPLPVPQALPVPERRPLLSTCTHCVDALASDETTRFVVDAVPETVRAVVDALPLNFWRPEKVLASPRSVEDAAVIVMSAVPLKEVPLMVRAFWSAVAVPALPEMEPVIRELKVFDPEKVLASERSVEDAAPASEVRYPFVLPQ